MRNYVFDIYIDISGRPRSKMYLGLIAINANFAHDFVEAFEANFPRLLRSKVKGKDLSQRRLSEVIDFFDANRAYFTSCIIKADEWQCYKDVYSGISFFEERVYGIAYYRLFERVAKRNSAIRYNAVLCEDNQIDTKRARKYTKFLLACERETPVF